MQETFKNHLPKKILDVKYMKAIKREEEKEEQPRSN